MPPPALPERGRPRERGAIEFRRFSYLAALPEEPEWLWRGYLAPGSLTMLAGHPFKGKSMLVGGLLKAMEEGRAFLGRETRRATALLVSEEDETALRARADVLGLLQLKSEYVSRGSGVLGLTWPELVEDASERAIRHDHSLLVIDTFPGLAELEDEQENDAGAIAKRLRPLQEAAGEGLAVLFLHHMNGQGQPRGSKAFRGIVDTLIRFSRSGTSHVFTLDAESRFPSATPAKLRAELVQASPFWVFRGLDGGSSGTSTQDGGESTDARLRRALVEAGPSGLTYEHIDRIDGLSEDKAKKRLPRWYEARKISRRGKGSKSDPYRWYV
jgi:hypothetical protein